MNVAGFDVEGAFLEGDPRRLLALMRVNMEAGIVLTHTLAGAHHHWEPLRIVNTTSPAASYPMPYKALYSASKRFVLTVSLALRDELCGIATLTTLCPAGTPTTRATIAAIDDQELMGRLMTMNTIGGARHADRAAVPGRPVVVPGLANRLVLAISRLLPATALAEAIRRRWGSARSSRPRPIVAGGLTGRRASPWRLPRRARLTTPAPAMQT